MQECLAQARVYSLSVAWSPAAARWGKSGAAIGRAAAFVFGFGLVRKHTALRFAGSPRAGAILGRARVTQLVLAIVDFTRDSLALLPDTWLSGAAGRIRPPSTRAATSIRRCASRS